jgi:hypothetical protein
VKNIARFSVFKGTDTFTDLDKSNIIVQTKRKINHTTLSEEEFEYIKGVIRIRKSKKDRQHNGEMSC